MKKDIVIFGGGAFGREVAWLIKRINMQKDEWNFLGFVDDVKDAGTMVDDYTVLGGSEWLKNYEQEIYCVCALGTGAPRKKVMESFKSNRNIKYPVLIDPSVILATDCEIGEGSIICAGNILAINVKVGKHVIINLGGTLGHDDIIGDYCTINPGCNISGNVVTGECVDVGTGSKIIEKMHIVSDTTIGAGSVVVKNIEQSGTYVGVPVKAIKLK